MKLKSTVIDDVDAFFKRLRISRFHVRFTELETDPDWVNMTPTQVLLECLEAEWLGRRETNALKLVKQARFPAPHAHVDDITYLASRDITKPQMTTLAQCDWIEAGRNVLLLSPTGAGKSYIAQALGVAACHKQHSVAFTRLKQLDYQLQLAATDIEKHHRIIARYKDVDLVILDDFFTTPISNQTAYDLFDSAWV